MEPMDQPHNFTQPHQEDLAVSGIQVKRSCYHHDDVTHAQYPELGFMSHSGHQGQGHRLRHGSGHSELETEEGGSSVQYPGNYYGEREESIERGV